MRYIFLHTRIFSNLDLDKITRLSEKIRNQLDENCVCGILVDSSKASDMADHKTQIY